jgi:hypothetical protein
MRYITQHRRGTKEQWEAYNMLKPAAGELVIEIDEENKLHKFKIGDGVNVYKDLPYFKSYNEIQSEFTFDESKFATINGESVVGDKEITIGAGGTIVIDQTYDPSSTKAQSGKAVAQAIAQATSIQIISWGDGE